jgi:hypothetical protein
VSVILAQMLELTDENIVVVIGAVSDGSWSQVVDNDLGASASYLFSAGIDTTTALGVNIPNEARIELQYYMFNSETQLSVGNVAFNALPSFAKFTIRIFDWPWRSSPENHRIEFHMKIDPPFTSFVEQTNTPNVTTYVLAGQYPAVAGQPNTTSALRLLNTVEIDGEQVESGVSFLMNTDSSELMLYFNYFESTLVYDPGKHSQSRLHSWVAHNMVTDTRLISRRCGSASAQHGQARWRGHRAHRLLDRNFTHLCVVRLHLAAARGRGPRQAARPRKSDPQSHPAHARPLTSYPLDLLFSPFYDNSIQYTNHFSNKVVSLIAHHHLQS